MKPILSITSFKALGLLCNVALACCSATDYQTKDFADDIQFISGQPKLKKKGPVYFIGPYRPKEIPQDMAVPYYDEDSIPMPEPTASYSYDEDGPRLWPTASYGDDDEDGIPIPEPTASYSDDEDNAGSEDKDFVCFTDF